VHPERGFVDDPFAVSADGTRLAFVTTDGASHSELHLVRIGAAGLGASFPYPSITPERVEFLDGERVLVVERSPESGAARGMVYGPRGPARERFGPADGIALGTVAGTEAIVAWSRVHPAHGPARHELTAWRRDDLRPLAKKTLAENADGRVPVAGGLYKPLFYLAGFVELVAQKEGDYDKAHDIRKPDQAARIDVFTGRLVEEHEIGDLVAWTVLLKDRQKHQNEPRYLRFGEDLRRLELVDGERVAELRVPRPLAKYDPQTLAAQEVAGALVVSLTVDPVNAEAVRAQKADKDWLDFYRLDAASGALAEIVRLDGEKRASTWRIGGGRLALLRKHKGFGRGGADLEVYALPAPAAATAAKAAVAPAPAPAK
jgi:hypothetical protein